MNKISEIQTILRNHDALIDVLPAQFLPGGMPEVEENGSTYVNNARSKSFAVLNKLPENAYVLGDDSGIEVDILDGAPGLFSARYAGSNASCNDNITKMIKEMKDVPRGQRGGQFISVLVLLSSNQQEKIFTGVCRGKIHTEAVGADGFGYDSVFIPDGFNKTFAQLGRMLKNKICHRRKAIEKLIQYLDSH